MRTSCWASPSRVGPGGAAGGDGAGDGRDIRDGGRLPPNPVLVVLLFVARVGAALFATLQIQF